MTSASNKPNTELAEYVFLLPQLLAVSPLFAVFRHINRYGEGADFVYSFRLITLAYILMVTALILFVWKPSIRRKLSFRRNLTRATLLGTLATVPIPLAMLVLGKYPNINVQLFSPFETTVSTLALMLCVSTNVLCLWQLARSLPRAQVHRFDYLSIAVNLILLGLLIKWW